MESNSTAFLIKIKLRQSLGRPSRSDFVQVQFYDTTTHVLENAIERMETLQKEQEKQAEAKAPSYPKKTTPELSPSF